MTKNVFLHPTKAPSLLTLPEDVQRRILTSYPHSPSTVQTLVQVSQTCSELQCLANTLLLRVLPEVARFASLDVRQRRAADTPILRRLTPSQRRVWWDAVVLRRSVWVSGPLYSGKSFMYEHLCEARVPGLCVVHDDPPTPQSLRKMRHSTHTQMVVFRSTVPEQAIPAYADRAWGFYRLELQRVSFTGHDNAPPVNDSVPWWWLLRGCVD